MDEINLLNRYFMMLLVDAIKYLDPLGSRRYFFLMAAPAGSNFSLLIFDPGPPGTESVVIEHVRKYVKFLRRNYRAKIKNAYILLTHTHPTSAGSSGRLAELLSKKFNMNVSAYAHVWSIPLIEKGKRPEDRMAFRFERETKKRLWLFKELSPPIYWPYYIYLLTEYSLPPFVEPLIPEKRTPEEFSRKVLPIDVDMKIERMRSAGHSYEHVVYRVIHEDFRFLILGDEGPVMMGAFPIRYNDATSRPYAIKNLEKRHDAIFAELDHARVFRSHGASRFTKLERSSYVNRFLTSLREAASSGFETLEEVVRMRISDAAAAMILRHQFAKFPETVKRSKIAKTHYINAENLPIFTARAALVYINGRGIHKKIITRNIDPDGKYRYVEVLSPSRASEGFRSQALLSLSFSPSPRSYR